MKQTTRLTLALAILVLAVLAGLFIGLTLLQPNAPRFTPAQTVTSVQQLSYDFLNPRPFEGGAMWINALAGATNGISIIYDLDKRRVVGQVTNGVAELLLGGPRRLLCAQEKPTAPRSPLLTRLLQFITQMSGGRVKFPPRIRPCLTYWVLDLEKNTSVRLGDLSGVPAFSLIASPDCRYCYTARQDWPPFPRFFLLDSQEGHIQSMDITQWPCDWWDETRILIQTTNADLVLYDVRRKAVSPLVTFEKIAAFLRENGITEDPSKAQPFAIWNGRENDFYLTDTHQKWLAQESFLIKVERPDGRLRLLSARFKFGWSDHLDPTGRYYLYSGRESGGGSDGVILRDLASGTNRVLVEPGTNQYFSIPRFYRDSVIYVRSNALWQVGLDGASNSQLFPQLQAPER